MKLPSSEDIGIDALLDRRLVFVVGKGGVGKTTVTLATALLAARRGQRVLLVELEGARALGDALQAQRGSRHPPNGLERVEHLVVDGRRALEEYLGMVVPVRRLLKTVFSSTVYQYFVAAAPGLKELMTIGKIWYEAERLEREGSGPDIVLVDSPATGHSLQYLRMPAAALEAFPSGLVHREAERVVSLLRDGDRTGVVVVTIAEDMPANETVEMVDGLAGLGMHRAALVVNQLHRAPVDASPLRRLRAALDAGGDAGSAALAQHADLLQEVVGQAEEELGWASINEGVVERLEQRIGGPALRLPYLFGEEFGSAQIRQLSEELEQLTVPAGGRP